MRITSFTFDIRPFNLSFSLERCVALDIFCYINLQLSSELCNIAEIAAYKGIYRPAVYYYTIQASIYYQNRLTEHRFAFTHWIVQIRAAKSH